MKKLRLTEICDFQGGTQPPKSEWKKSPTEGYIRMLQIRDFTQSKAEHIEYVKDSKKLNKCYRDDVLLGRYGASVGKILTGLEGAYNVAIIKAIPNEELLTKRFLYYILTGSTFQKFISNIGARAAQAGFNKSDLSSFEVFLPPVEDQIRIANILSKAEALISQRKESLRLLDEFLKSTFLEMFGDPLTNPHHFPIRTLDEFYINDKDGTKCGPFGSALKKEEYKSEGVPVWVMDNITKDGKFAPQGCLWIGKEKFKSLKGYGVQNGDVIISRAGTVGKMCVVQSHFSLSIISTNLIRVRFGRQLLPLYFVSLMNYCRSRVARLRTGADDTFTHMNTKILDSIKFPCPPLALQNQFTELVKKTEALKAHYQRSLQELENLHGSLSQKAFRGEFS